MICKGHVECVQLHLAATLGFRSLHHSVTLPLLGNFLRSLLSSISLAFLPILIVLRVRRTHNVGKTGKLLLSFFTGILQTCSPLLHADPLHTAGRTFVSFRSVSDALAGISRVAL